MSELRLEGEEMVDDAIAQLVSHAQLLEEQWNAGVAEYAMVSARECLYVLGFEEDEADETLREVARRGFAYCLDPIVPCSSAVVGGAPEGPPRSACVWGIDQLRSRLECLGSRATADAVGSRLPGGLVLKSIEVVGGE